MPRIVDADARREEILRVAVLILARDGYDKLSLRSVGKELGGSQSLVTHYFDSRQALLADVAASMDERWTAEIAEAQEGLADPADRLQALMIWLIPNTPEKLDSEKWRMQVSAAKFRDPVAAQILVDFDRFVRRHMRSAVEELVPPDQVESTVDFARAIASGIELETYEHGWDSTRQERLVEMAMQKLLAHDNVSP